MMEEQALEKMNEAHELAMLKRLFKEKLNHYNGITHGELENICTMLGITKAKEEKPDE